MLGLDVPKTAFVATATATGVIVDIVRMPVYIATEGAAIWDQRTVIGIASMGVLVGTWAGMHLLRRIPEALFRTILSLVLIALAAWSFFQAGAKLGWL
jgi:uncharacterized membrane protein YfcA